MSDSMTYGDYYNDDLATCVNCFHRKDINFMEFNENREEYSCVNCGEEE